MRPIREQQQPVQPAAWQLQQRQRRGRIGDRRLPPWPWRRESWVFLFPCLTRIERCGSTLTRSVSSWAPTSRWPGARLVEVVPPGSDVALVLLPPDSEIPVAIRMGPKPTTRRVLARLPLAADLVRCPLRARPPPRSIRWRG